MRILFPFIAYTLTLSLSGNFFLVKDRTLRSLQVKSDGASVLEFCWIVSTIDVNLRSPLPTPCMQIERCIHVLFTVCTCMPNFFFPFLHAGLGSGTVVNLESAKALLLHILLVQLIQAWQEDSFSVIYVDKQVGLL